MNTYAPRLPHLIEPTDTAPAELGAELPVTKPPAGLSITQALVIVRHYWRLSALIAAGCFLIAAGLIKVLPRTYQATATLIVNPVRPDPLPQQPLPGDDLSSYVMTQAELILSPVVLLPVVDRQGLVGDRHFTSGFTGAGASARRQYAAQSLGAALSIAPGAGNQLVYLTASADSPTEAATLANAVADSYLQLERRRANDPVAQQAQRSSEELSELRAQVTAAQNRVTQFRERNDLTTLSPQADDSAMQALQSLQTRLLDAQNQIRTLEARQAGQIGSGDEALASGRVEALRGDLARLQARLAQLRSTLGPRHPEIVSLRAQIAATRGALRSALGTLSGNIATQLARERALATQLQQAVTSQRAKVLHLRQIQDQGSKLQLELESAQSVYRQALAGYDEVKSAAVQNFANVSLISRATPPVRYTKPNKLRLLEMALLASIAAALAIPLGYELLLDRRLRCREDLERGFGIRVLAQLNRVQLPADAL